MCDRAGAPSARARLLSLQPLLLFVCTTFMAWKSLSLLTNSSHPVLVVVSESMAPAFHRGDLILLSNRSQIVQIGQIPVCWFPGRPLPMVHRAVQIHWQAEEIHNVTVYNQKIVTKGDNNDEDDKMLYPAGQDFVDRREVLGVVVGYLPFLGWATIIFNEHPWLRAGGILGTLLVGIFM